MNRFSPGQVVSNITKRWFPKRTSLSCYPNEARNTSAWVIGQPGMGKSKLIESQLIQDIRSGRGVGLIDVHGDLFQNVLRRVAAMAIHDPQLARRVIIVDPTQPAWTASLNPLEAIEGMSPERTALFLTDIVTKIWQINPNESPRLVWLLTNAFLALAMLNLTLADFPRWLQDKEWRNQQVPMISHEAVRRYWQDEFPYSDQAIQQWIAPATNKLGGLLFDSQVRQILTGSSQVSMRKIMDDGLVLLVHIPKGILGEKSAHLLAAFIVAQIQKSALSRADAIHRRPFYLYLDEFQNYTTDYIQDVLAESRKYSLSLVLAHQFLEQLSPSMRSAVLNTSGTIVSFRVGYKDARAMVHEVFPTPEFPLYRGDTGRGGWEKLALDLANLPPREFWVRRRGPYLPTKKRTLDIPDLRVTPQLESAVERLLRVSGQLYAGSRHRNSTGYRTEHQVTTTIQASVASHQMPSDPIPDTGLRAESGVELTKSEDNQDEPANLYSEIIWDE